MQVHSQPASLALTLLLFYAFGNLRPAMLVLLNVPFALVGGAVGLWVADMPMSIAAAVGFIALVVAAGAAAGPHKAELEVTAAREALQLPLHERWQRPRPLLAAA